MKQMKALVITLVCAAALSISAAAVTLGSTQDNKQNPAACCDMAHCCKGEMSCCKAKKEGKNAHSCCKDMDNKEACCCGAGECPMPNKKTSNTNTH